ncbi:hypothetical protein EW146_g1000 [Bondarzewia mesenterica]|uniref:Uncharacterized protein n=1 Tax=Bondarzewia mesenterica TaxID=1095465 RepID=A0A4S4M566_9AGAM|nr:hypothetical protein EW146_g1000 [Bondarzewia mesenterica]
MDGTRGGWAMTMTMTMLMEGRKGRRYFCRFVRRGAHARPRAIAIRFSHLGGPQLEFCVWAFDMASFFLFLPFRGDWVCGGRWDARSELSRWVWVRCATLLSPDPPEANPPLRAPALPESGYTHVTVIDVADVCTVSTHLKIERRRRDDGTARATQAQQIQ